FDLRDQLIGNDLVVEGKVLDVRDTVVSPLWDCNAAARRPGIQLSRYLIQVDTVLIGQADPIVALYTLGQSGEEHDKITNLQVLAYGFRNCRDEWRLWGYLYHVDDRSRVGPMPGEGPVPLWLRGRPERDTIPLSAVHLALDKDRKHFFSGVL